jgi:hypothetical protein
MIEISHSCFCRSKQGSVPVHDRVKRISEVIGSPIIKESVFIALLYILRALLRGNESLLTLVEACWHPSHLW